MATVNSLLEAVKYFAIAENCHKFMVGLRWPDGVVKCPRCGAEKVTYLAKPRVWKCYAKHERPTFSLKTGTIFEDSPIALEKWMAAAWLVINCKNGVSSYEVSRDLKVTQKSAWFMLHRIRLALQEGNLTKLSGEVEVDESFIGGKARNMHAAKRLLRMAEGHKGKTIAFGMVERGGKVKTAVVDRRSKKQLQAQIRENIEAGSAIFSDELLSYDGLAAEYKHAVINHAVEYVNGNVHTNTMENFWSLVKRQIHGTYVNVEPYHLFRYLDEQAFRYNFRKMSDGDRFEIAMQQIVGRRLTYEELTGKTESQAEQRPSIQ